MLSLLDPFIHDQKPAFLKVLVDFIRLVHKTLTVCCQNHHTRNVQFNSGPTTSENDTYKYYLDSSFKILVQKSHSKNFNLIGKLYNMGMFCILKQEPYKFIYGSGSKFGQDASSRFVLLYKTIYLPTSI